jgi:hypothetical protein
MISIPQQTKTKKTESNKHESKFPHENPPCHWSGRHARVSALAEDNKPLSAEDSILTTVTATVQAIDPPKRPGGQH